MSTFEDTPQSKLSKTWVKAGTFNAGNRKEDATGKGQLYKPASRLDLQAQKEKMDARVGPTHAYQSVSLLELLETHFRSDSLMIM